MTATTLIETQLPSALQLLLSQAQEAERRGQCALARACFETALRRLPGHDDGRLAATLLRWIGRTYIAEGDHDAALDCLTASVAAAEATGATECIAHALNLLGIARQQAGALDEAERHYSRAHQLATASGEANLAAMLDQNLGTVANIRGDMRRALRHYRRSLRAYETLGMHGHVGRVLNNLGMLGTDLRRWRMAERAFEGALEAAGRAGDAQALAMIHVNRAELRAACRDLEGARRDCERALHLAQASDNYQARGETYKQLGVIHREMQRFRMAESYFQRAEQIAGEQGNLLLAAENAREQALLFAAQDRNRETLQSLNRAHRLFTSLRAQRDLRDIGAQLHRLETTFLDIVRRWGESIDDKDPYTQGHSVRVADYACALAAELGYDEATLFWFRLGALLHDVGKIVVPIEILNKPDRLTSGEFAVIKRHPEAGVELLAGIDFPWDVRPMVRHHHEHWDGSGYPHNLAGEAIPESARILCVADVFDALTTTRSYRKAFSREAALDIMRADAGRLFDPAILDVFIERVIPRLADDAPAAPALAPGRAA